MDYSLTIMKTLMAFCVLGITSAAVASPIGEMVEKNPAKLEQIVRSSDYKQLLVFLNGAYAERGSDKNGLAEYAYLLALTYVPANEKIGVAIDFLLAKPDLRLKIAGATTIEYAVYDGSPMTSVERVRAIDQLRAQAHALTARGPEAFMFARRTADALVALGEDAGLDVFLTDPEEARNYGLEDRWAPDSPASLFQTLERKYTQKAEVSKLRHDRLMAAIYRLCAERRANGVEIAPIRPMVDLSSL